MVWHSKNGKIALHNRREKAFYNRRARHRLYHYAQMQLKDDEWMPPFNIQPVYYYGGWSPMGCNTGRDRCVARGRDRDDKRMEDHSGCW